MLPVSKQSTSETVHTRYCPACGAENPNRNDRCSCGAPLTGADSDHKDSGSQIAIPETAEETTVNNDGHAQADAPETQPGFEDTQIDWDSNQNTATDPFPLVTADILPLPGIVFGEQVRTVNCPYTDCGAENPPGQNRCLYCDRPMVSPQQAYVLPFVAPAPQQDDLPFSLRDRFLLIESQPTSSVTADLFHLRRISDSSEWMLKLYRHGIVPDMQLSGLIDRIRLPQILPIAERGIIDGRHWELTAFCPLGNLRRYFDRGALPVETIRRLVAEIYQALALLHANKILHRDLKPENIVVMHLDPLSVALIDFSVAANQDSASALTGIVRNFRYAPPATLTGVVTTHTDWWALGIIVMEAFLGRHPLEGLSEQEITLRLAGSPIDTGIITDPDVEKLCRGLLTRNPNRAWGADEVARWIAGDPTLAVKEDTALPSAHPFVLGESKSCNAQELAAAILNNWEQAVKEWQRGNIRRWIEIELGNQNLYRVIRNLEENAGLGVEAKLLHFVTDCDPRAPLIWKGRMVNQDTILYAAASSLLDDHQWLASVFDEKILDLLNEHENPALNALHHRWKEAWAYYCELWNKVGQAYDSWARRPRRTDQDGNLYISFDDVSYVPTQPMPRLPKHRILSALLRVLTDESFVDRLRHEIRTSSSQLEAQCPWFFSLGDPANFNSISLVVAQHLLRYAQSDTKKQREEERQLREKRQMVFATIRKEFTQTFDSMQQMVEPFPATPGECNALLEKSQALNRIFEQANGFKTNNSNVDHWFQQIKPLWPPLTEATERLAIALRYAFSGSNPNHPNQEAPQNEIFILIIALALFVLIGLLGSWWTGSFVGAFVLAYWVVRLVQRKNMLRAAQHAYQRLLERNNRIKQAEEAAKEALAVEPTELAGE